MSQSESLSGANAAAERSRVLAVDATLSSITAEISEPVLRGRAGLGWWTGFALGVLATGAMLLAIFFVLYKGIGIWGDNSTVVWGVSIANYAWWIGLGNAGLLISCILLMTRQKWRASVSRIAETIALLAAGVAGIFPIIHLGRPYLFYWVAPYPDVMQLWPQWRSALVGDFFSIAAFVFFAFIFWYTGAMPDFATLRDRAETRAGQVFYGALAMGWRGSARQWHHYDSFYYALASLGIPLVVMTESVAATDLAASLMPGWQDTMLPFYFTVGSLFSGFAMLMVLAIPIRTALKLQRIITRRHFDVGAKMLLAGSVVIGLCYLSQWFTVWYANDKAGIYFTKFEFNGVYATRYWIAFFCNVVVGQLFWWPRARRSLPLVFVVAILISTGIWMEHVLLEIHSLSRGYLPSQWREYVPTIWDWLLTAGALGFFFFLFFVFVRVFPACSMHEVRNLLGRKEVT